MSENTFVPEPMRQAFASRFRELVDQLARTMDPATIADALARADSRSGLLVALERAGVMEGVIGDPLAPARARGASSRMRLISRAGGVLRLAEAAERLNVTPQAVTGRRSRGTILAVPMPNGEWVYPVCQFTPEGIVPGLAAFLREFKDVSSWSQLSVLLARSERFEGRTALDLLSAGEADAARAIAATYGEQG